MSALDLFASAMGAFILIAVVALPYYLKTDKSLLEENRVLKQQLVEVRSSLDQCRIESAKLTQQVEQEKAKARESAQAAEDTQQQLQNCQKKLKETFIAVVMQWSETGVDIDLYVTDPDGNEFYFSKDNRTGSDYPNSDAKLSRDTTRGPGVEVWEIPLASQGRYKIAYKFHSGEENSSNTSKISANIYTNKGSHAMRTVTLRKSQKKQVASVVIDGEGNVRFE